MEFRKESSSNITDDSISGTGEQKQKKLGRIIAMHAAAALALLLAFLGGRSSNKGTKTNGTMFLNEAVPNRLCEIYHDPKSADYTNARIIQTSLGEPSKQWSEVA